MIYDVKTLNINNCINI